MSSRIAEFVRPPKNHRAHPLPSPISLTHSPPLAVAAAAALFAWIMTCRSVSPCPCRDLWLLSAIDVLGLVLLLVVVAVAMPELSFLVALVLFLGPAALVAVLLLVAVERLRNKGLILDVVDVLERRAGVTSKIGSRDITAAVAISLPNAIATSASMC